MARQPEAILGNQIKKYLEVRGWKLIKLHGNQFQSGLPDYVALYPGGKIKWIEIKTPTGRLSSRQIEKFSLLEKMGQQIYILTCLEECKWLDMQPNWSTHVRF